MEKEFRVNERIRSKRVRLIDENGKQVGIVSIDEALRFAEQRNLDLVEVAPISDPPVCKIMDYGKFKYQQQMKEQGSKKKQHVIKIKEVRLRPQISDHDLAMKINSIREFLNNGCKVKVLVMFRGRELAHTEFGYKLINRLTEAVSDIGEIEKGPTTEERNLVTYFGSK